MCTCTCRIVLFAVNVLVGLIGFLLMLFGSLMSWGKLVVREQLAGHISPFVRTMYGTETAEKVAHLTDLVLRFTAPFGLLIFGFGTAILVLCIFGCCGACNQKAHCLRIYTALLLLITCAEIALLAFYYTNRSMVFDWTQKLLYQSLLQYQSLESEDPHSMLFNLLMTTFNCCGLHNGDDFTNARNFQQKMNYSNEEITLAYPVACCKLDAQLRVLNDTCPGTFDEGNSNIHVGCWDELLPHLLHYGNAVAIAGIVVLLFQVFLVAISVVTLAMKQL